MDIETVNALNFTSGKMIFYNESNVENVKLSATYFMTYKIGNTLFLLPSVKNIR